MNPPKLTIELVPKTSWFNNVRTIVSTEDWDRIRKSVYARAGHRCEICGGKGPKHPVECHEVWIYDDETHRQTLARMIALCPSCHECKHAGLANIRGRGDLIPIHLAMVNEWSIRRAERYVDEQFEIWEQRSRFEWTLDVECLREYDIDPGKLERQVKKAARTSR